MQPRSIMAHLVAGFPNSGASLAIAQAFAAGGAAALELQFPFSDPIADGAQIEAACHVALQNGFRIDDGFNLAQQIVANTGLPLFCMSYAALPYRIGVEQFVKRAAAAGVTGLIIPDLLPPHDEHLYDYCAKYHIAAVIVSVMTITEERFRALLEQPQQYIYMALRSGITGTTTAIDAQTIERLGMLKAAQKIVCAGFGVRNAQQVALLAPHVDYVVVGSHFVKIITDALPLSPESPYLQTLERATRALRTASG